MQTAARWRIAHFFYAIDFPRIAFRNQAVKKGADRAANTAKENRQALTLMRDYLKADIGPSGRIKFKRPRAGRPRAKPSP